MNQNDEQNWERFKAMSKTQRVDYAQVALMVRMARPNIGNKELAEVSRALIESFKIHISDTDLREKLKELLGDE